MYLTNIGKTGKCEASFSHPDFVKCAVPILDGAYLVTGCRDEHIRVWDMGTDKCVRIVKGHSDEVSCLAVEGQTLWSGSIDGTVRSWNLAG